jgi:hypothetical protein
MMGAHTTWRALTLLAASALVSFASVGAAQATLAPVKLVQTSHFPTGLEFAFGVAVNNDPSSSLHGDVYVVDLFSHRVQVFTPAGGFVEMFGREVNAGKPGNVCLAGEECRAGAGGPEPGQFAALRGIAVDPSTGGVFVDESAGEGERVQEFTAEGQFVLEIGREVNKTAAQKNVCTQAEISKGAVCGPPQETSGPEPGAFNFASTGAPNILAAGGPKDLLFVGDENGVQEFSATTGTPTGEIPLTSIEPGGKVRALTLEQATGDLYLLYPQENSGVVRKFTEGGAELASFTVKPRTARQEVFIGGIALDPSGRLAVSEKETGSEQRGSLYEPASGKRVTGFTAPPNFGGMAFDAAGDMYVAAGFPGNAEVFAYTPEPVAELALTAVGACNVGGEVNTLVSIACPLNGEVNPVGVPETEVFFEYGRTTALDQSTAKQPVSAAGPVQVTASPLRPNETYRYRLAGFDANVKAPEEALATEPASLTTPTVAPQIVGAHTLGVSTASVVLFAELDPENAQSEFLFEYARGAGALAKCAGLRREACPGVQGTPVTVSSVYGLIGARAEVSGLQPATTYSFRLFAEDQSAANPAERFQAVGPEATFTTQANPTVHATTAPASAVTATAATVSGTVDSEGQPAAYTVELAVAGPEPQYGDVYSASTGDATGPVEVKQQLTGLQPATSYAYRITIRSGYGETTSEPQTFTTEGLPALLASPAALALLPTPAVAFPSETVNAPPKKLRRAQLPKAALKACRKKHNRSKRHACERQAHRKYGPAKKKTK